MGYVNHEIIMAKYDIKKQDIDLKNEIKLRWKLLILVDFSRF